MPPLRERVLAGGPVAGTFVQTPHPVVPELLGHLGVDFVCVDQEHSAMGPETVQALVAAAALAGLPALVRVADATIHHLAAALDAGAAGVVVPRVSSAGTAAGAVRASRYPPQGERGIGPGRAAGYGRTIADALARANETTLVAVQIETRTALERVEEIAAVDGVDLLFIGPGDLSVSLGLAGGMADPALDEAVERVLTAASAAGRAAGIFAPDVERARRWRERGFALVVVGSDLGFMAEGIERAWTTLGP